MENEESLRKRKDEQEERIELAGSGRRVNDSEDAIKTYSIKIRYHGNPESQLRYSSDEVQDIIKRAVIYSDETKGISQRMKLELEREVKHGFVSMTEYFDSGFEIVEDDSKVHQVFIETSKRIILAIKSFLEDGSWVTSKVIEYILTIAPLKPEEYEETISSFTDLPPEISHSKKGLVNVRNKHDSKCLMWSHVRHLKSDPNPGRISESDREFAKTLDYTGISFPTPLSQVAKVEAQNDISINVFRYEEGKLTPAFITKLPNRKNMNLLLLGEHYVLIKNFSSLLFGLTGKKGTKFFCYPCVEGFVSEKLLRTHNRTCVNRKVVENDDVIKVQIGKPGKYVRIRDKSKLKVEIVD